ncbi:MAG: energy transducer TonB [Janthinobacterium lividum]
MLFNDSPSRAWCYIFLLFAPLATRAQQPAASSDKVYTYVEQMPELPGGGGTGAIVAAFQKRLRYPAVPLNENVSSRVAVYFEINTSGMVQHIRIARSSRSPTLDKAAIAAVKALPTFTPGYHNGHPVTVSLSLPVTICFQ